MLEDIDCSLSLQIVTGKARARWRCRDDGIAEFQSWCPNSNNGKEVSRGTTKRYLRDPASERQRARQPCAGNVCGGAPVRAERSRNALHHHAPAPVPARVRYWRRL